MEMKIKVSRSQLYEKVWSTPMLQLGEEYGISDVGLAKLCKKHNIPRPPRGYWAKKQAGQKPMKVQLPKSNGDTAIYLNDPESVRSIPKVAKAKLDKPEPKIQVKETLHGCLDLIREAREELSASKKDDDGLLVSKNCPLDVSVSKQQLRRALLILDALLSELIKRGFVVSAGPKVRINDEEIGFGIYERVVAVSKPAQDQDLEGRYEFRHSRTESSRSPSGQLVFIITDSTSCWVSYGQKSWGDGKKQRLENCLNKIVAGLIAFADATQQARILEQEREEQRRVEAQQKAEDAKLRTEKRELQKAEQSRLELLLKQVENWQKSNDIRQFVQAVEKANKELGMPIDLYSELGQWLEFAAVQADRFDPMITSPPSILDEEIPDERSWY